MSKKPGDVEIIDDVLNDVVASARSTGVSESATANHVNANSACCVNMNKTAWSSDSSFSLNSSISFRHLYDDTGWLIAC